MSGMSGHLFVLHGDLTRLQCDAVLIPCDNRWQVGWRNWSRLLDETLFKHPSHLGRAQLKEEHGTGRYKEQPDHDGKRIRLVVTADGRNDADWVATGVSDAIRTLAAELSASDGRAKPLVALPLVGTGQGGFDRARGMLIKASLPELQAAAESSDVDVALVLADDRDHIAIQGQRREADWCEFEPHELAIADRLGEQAARGELSLYLGSGVSVPLGLPDWPTLLEELGKHRIDDYSPDRAPRIAQ